MDGLGIGDAPPGTARHEMSARPGPAIDAGHRTRVLCALGLVPWTRRTPAPVSAAPDDAGAADVAVAADAGASCAIVLAERCSSRALDLLGRALHAGGPRIARAGRVRVRDGSLAGLPAAAVYLVFGEAQAEILRQNLPGAAARPSHVVIVDELDTVLADGGAKRRLWTALRGLRARLAAADG